MDEREITLKLEEICKPVVEKLGLELYDLEYKRESTGWVVRIYISRKAGSVTIDDCTKVSRQLNLLLDVEDIVPHSYNLEVSSPGLTRTLKKLSHFEKSIGSKAKFKLKIFHDGKKTMEGIIKAVDGEEIVIELQNEELKINFKDIESAKLQID